MTTTTDVVTSAVIRAEFLERNNVKYTRPEDLIFFAKAQILADRQLMHIESMYLSGVINRIKHNTL